MPAGAQFLLLNGLIYETHDFNLYAFLDTLRREVSEMGRELKGGWMGTDVEGGRLLLCTPTCNLNEGCAALLLPKVLGSLLPRPRLPNCLSYAASALSCIAGPPVRHPGRGRPAPCATA